MNAFGVSQIEHRDPWFIRVDRTRAGANIEILLGESNGLDNGFTGTVGIALDPNMLIRLVLPDCQTCLSIPIGGQKKELSSCFMNTIVKWPV